MPNTKTEPAWRTYQRSRRPEEKVEKRVARWAGQQREKAREKPGLSGKINFLLADQAAADARRRARLAHRETKKGIRERKVAAFESRLGRKQF